MLDSNLPMHDRRNGEVGTAAQHVGMSAVHYHVSNPENPNFTSGSSGKWFDNKKEAKRMVDTHTQAGYAPQATKYSGGDYSQGKPAFKARIATSLFMKGHPVP